MSGHKSSHFTNLKSWNTTNQITALAQVWLMISHDLIDRVGKQHVKKNQFTRKPPPTNLMKKHLILASLEPRHFPGQRGTWASRPRRQSHRLRDSPMAGCPLDIPHLKQGGFEKPLKGQGWKGLDGDYLGWIDSTWLNLEYGWTWLYIVGGF